MLAGCATPPEIVEAPLVPGPSSTPQCASYGSVIGHLAKKYGEVPVAAGLTNQGGLIGVLTTIDGKTWTILITTSNGISCYVTSGEGWRTKAWAEPKPEGMAL